MEYLLINHPVDCPVCDQAGECSLQDYSYRYGRSASRFQEEKLKQPKKDLGPNVLLYSDRCIMCTRCVRFTREVTGTSELIVEGRGALEQIDVFPGLALDNELSGNVIDLCPVGALLDKDFLFQQRVWYLTSTPSIDGITSGGDNISVEHNNGVVYRIKPRTNPEVNGWWISDEIRYGWEFVHDESRHRLPCSATTCVGRRLRPLEESLTAPSRDCGRRVASRRSSARCCPARMPAPRSPRRADPEATLVVGPSVQGEDKSFPGAPSGPRSNAAVSAVLAALGGEVLSSIAWAGVRGADGLLVTGNYPSLGHRCTARFPRRPLRRADGHHAQPAGRTGRRLPALRHVDGEERHLPERRRSPGLRACDRTRRLLQSEAQIAIDLLAVIAANRALVQCGHEAAVGIRGGTVGLRDRCPAALGRAECRIRHAGRGSLDSAGTGTMHP